MKTKFLTLIIAFVMVLGANAQDQMRFSPTVVGFSKKKTAYIFKENGDKITCTIKSLKWTKGLIDEIKILDLEGNKVKISPEDISHMYLPPSAAQKLGNALDFADNATQWDNSDLDKELLGEKLVYFEKTKMKVKKKVVTVMAQVLNVTYCKQIRVYADPYAKETMGASVGGVTVAGGLDKSYYIKKAGEDTGYKLEKKNYTEEFKLIFSEAPKLTETYGDAPKWKEFETHVWEFAMEMNGGEATEEEEE